MSTLGQQIEAMLRDPLSEDAAAAVRVSARESSAFEEYAEAFGARGRALAQRGEVDPAVEALAEAALVYEEELENLSEAAGLWEHVLRLQSGHRRALFTLGLLLHDLNRWDDLIALYRRRLDTSSDAGEQTTLHLYIAELLSERKNDDAAAFDEVLRAARLMPSNLRIISRVQHLGERTSRLDEVAVMIGDLLVQQDDPKLRAALSLRLAELNLGPLGDEQRALAYLRAALMDDGANPEILSEIEDVFRERHRFDALANVLEEAVTDRRVGPHRVRLERELARIYEKELNDLPRALAALGRAVRQTPEDRELLDEILRLGTAAERMDVVADAYEQVVATTDNPLLKTYMRLKLGYIYADSLGRLDDAVRVFSAILDAEPGHEEAQQRLLRIREKQAELHNEPDAVHASLTADIASEAADDDEELLDDPLQSVQPSALYSEGSDEEPTEAAIPLNDPEATRPGASPLAANEETHLSVEQDADSPAEADRHDDVSEMHVALAELSEDDVDEVIEVLTSDVELSDIDMEVSADAIVLAVDDDSAPIAESPPPASVEPSSSDATTWSPVDEAEPAGPPADDATAQQRAAPPLRADDPHTTFITVAGPVREEHLAQLERFEVLQRDLADAIETNDRVRIIHRLASVIEIYEEIRQFDRGLLAAVYLVEVAPREDHLQEVIRLGRASQAYEIMFDCVERVAAEMGPDQEVQFGLQLADVEIEDIGSLPKAIDRFERLAERFPENEALLGRWLTVLDKHDKPESMSDLLVRRSLREDDPRLAFPFIQRAMALLDERLDARKQATDLLLAFVERSDGYTVAREQLGTRMAEEGRHQQLADLVSRELEEASGEARVEKYLQLADIKAHGLGEPEEAESLLVQGLDEQPGSVHLLAGLMRLAETQGRWKDVLSLGQRQLDNATTVAERTTIRRHLAEIAEEKAEDTELAQELLASAIDEQPDDLRLMDPLLRLQLADHNWAGALETLRLKWGMATTPDVRADVALQRATIFAEQYDDLDEAIAAVKGALAEVPDLIPAMAKMADLAEAAGRYDDALRVLDRWAEVVDGSDRAEVHLHRGRLLESAFNDPVGASRAYEAALLTNGHHSAARRALLRMAEAQGDYVRALAFAIETAERTEDAREAALAWQHAGRLAQDGVGDDLEALRCYQRALAKDPEDLATEASVGELLLARRSFAEAYPHLDRAARGLSDPDRSADLHAAAASAASQLDKPDEAIRGYEAVLELRSDDRVALDRLGILLEERGEYGRVHDLGAHLLLRHEDELAPGERAQVYLRMARAKLNEQDYEAAVRLARRADALDETEAVLEVLAQALDLSGEPSEAADCLKRLAPMRVDDSARRTTLVRAARLLGDTGVDRARAAALTAEAQAVTPADLEVAELLCEYRTALGDARQAAAALWVPSQHVHGRPKANLLVRAARVLIEGYVARNQARRWLSQAVTIIPTHADALEDLRVILAFDGEYATLAQVQARAADAFLSDPGSEVDAGAEGRIASAEELLRSNLDLYRFRLDSPQRALASCQKLLGIHQEDPLLEEIRAHLLEELARRHPEPQLLDEAVKAWNRALERRPGDPELIRRAAELRKSAGQARATALLDELSAALGLSEPVEQAPSIAEDPTVPRLSIKPSAYEAASSARDWLDRLGYAPLVAFSDTLPEPRPKKRDLQTEADLGVDVSRPLAYASARLGMDPPPVYIREELEVPVRPTWVGNGPALLMAPDIGDLYPPGVVRFLLGRALGQLRGRALALVVVPLDVLREGLLGFAKVADPAAHLADPKTTKKRGRALERAVPSQDRQPLAMELAQWLADPNRRSLADEREAVLRTADRAGLMVAGSLTSALQGLQVLSDGRLERSWRVPLLEYAASQACAELMERLG